jgi:hypothetical protein
MQLLIIKFVSGFDRGATKIVELKLCDWLKESQNLKLVIITEQFQLV